MEVTIGRTQHRAIGTRPPSVRNAGRAFRRYFRLVFPVNICKVSVSGLAWGVYVWGVTFSMDVKM